MRLLLCLLCYTYFVSAAEKPNIIVILSDDAGFADFGFQGSKDYPTPHIDGIASNGVSFESGYVPGCVCSPSRAGLITGRYQQRFGYDNNLPPGHKLGLDIKEKTIADHLKALGYTTSVIGKWHLGYQPEYHPNKRGFDHFYGLLQGSRSYFKYENPSANRVIQENGVATKETSEYMTDRLGKAAVRFIESNKKKPFFIYLSFTAVHGPYQADSERAKAFANTSLSKSRQTLGAMTKALDDNVGLVMETLKKHELTENTIVVFLNDNGGTGPALNGPLRGKKGTLHEGGIRVPFAMQWPKSIPAGQKILDSVTARDLSPIFLRAAGLQELPKLDGMDLLPLLKQEIKSLNARTLFWRKWGSTDKGWAAARFGKWKFQREFGKLSLFDLEKDLTETTDLQSQQPELMKEFIAKMKTWESQLIEPLWGANSSPEKMKGETKDKTKKKKKKKKKS